jgi:hypothetical protein
LLNPIDHMRVEGSEFFRRHENLPGLSNIIGVDRCSA